ncbi:variable surface lipoprotein, partial [Mycoplasmopsis agalactiae]|uniref:variable surface lipoprotein n=1 Tax=Mycoplasmopsis agalactiae TaxID=2110 RepID=UPI000680B6FF
MKKSKFLLLGSVASMTAIPFVAAKCGDTKEDEKKPAETTPGNPTETPGGSQNNPGGNQNPGTEGGSNQQGSEINVKALTDKIHSIWGLAPKFEDRLQNSFKEGDTYQSVLDKIKSKLSDKEKELVKLASEGDKDKTLGLQAKQKIKIKVGTEEIELEFGNINRKTTEKQKLEDILKTVSSGSKTL